MKHELQYGDKGPDWCIHCGTFAHNISDLNEECKGRHPNHYDNRKPGAAQRFCQEVFGTAKGSK